MYDEKIYLNSPRSHWVRYDHYELKTAEDGKRYITPGKSAKPDVYNPLKEGPWHCAGCPECGDADDGTQAGSRSGKGCVMEFVTRYGLLGLMTALPTTPSFMDYEAGVPAEKPFYQGRIHGGQINICPCFTPLTSWTW